MKVLVIRPHTMTGKVASRTSKGMGMGSVLLDGTSGAAGTFTSDAPSVDGFRTTTTTGGSLGSSINAKLEKLRIQSKKKPSNIKFSI